MNILIICSKSFYKNIPEIKDALVGKGHNVSLPNCYDKPETEEQFKLKGEIEHSKFKAKMFRQSDEVISKVDAVLVLNYEKNGIPNYIGGATFLEMYDAFRHNKKIFMLNGLPEGVLQDEITGFNPIILNGDLSNIL